MLEDLDKVEWDKLRHAYGLAADVPARLRALTSPNRGVRQEAWYVLHGNLWHQGTIYEATAYAVPFLIQLACKPDVPDRHQILAYLGLIARGSSFLAVHQNLSHHEARKTEPDFQEELQRELGWVWDVRQAVRQGASLYNGLLDDGQPRVRAAAGHLLALLYEDAEIHLGWIRSRLAAGEPDDLIRATLAFCIGRLAAAAQHEESIGFLEQLVASDPAPAVRIAAALGLAWCIREAIPTHALTVLIDGTSEPHGTETIFHHVLYEDEDFWTWYGKALCCGEIHSRIVPAILSTMGKSNDPETIVERLLIAMLDDRPLKSGMQFSELKPSLCLALKGIAECEPLWIAVDRRADRYRDVSTTGAIAMLQYFGLPGRRQDFQAFVDGRIRSNPT